MEKQEELKYQVFKLIEEVITVSEFEEWLYVQDHLVENLEDELNLTLFSIDYRKSGLKHDFPNEMFKFYDREEFILWKVKLNLIELIEGVQPFRRDQILQFFMDLGDDGYEIFDTIGSNLYYYDDYIPNDYNSREFAEIIKKDAQDLLAMITSKEPLNPIFKLTDL